MTWDGPWSSQTWDGPWDGTDGGPTPPPANPAARGTLARQATIHALLAEIDGLRAALAVTPQLSATMTVLPPIYRGDDASLTLTVLDAAGAPTNITGDAIELEVKAAVGGPDPALIRKTVGSGITLLAQSGGTLGQATVAIAGTETDLAPGTYWIDVVHIRSGVRTHIIGPRAFQIAGVVNAR